MKLLQEKLSKYDAPQRAMAAGIYPYFRMIESDQDTEVIISGKKVLMFGSNAYLGLTNHPKVKEAAIDAIKKYGTGCAGSRFLNGTLDLHIQLEKRLAEFVGKEEAIIYSTGFQVNLGVVSCLTGREDYILWDELDHASIIEGHRLSYSTKLKYKHNDMESLEKQLQKCEPDKIKLIVTDGVFSMEGDVAKLPEIIALAKTAKTAAFIENIMKRAGAPLRPQDVGVDETIVHNSMMIAKEVRQRYTILNMLSDLGLTEKYTKVIDDFIKK